jgi:hypothetical protein
MANEAKKITKACKVKTDADAEKQFSIDVTFDFTGVSEEDVYQYATSYLVINRAQSKFRSMTESVLATLEKEGYVVKVAESGRAPADPARAIKKAFDKITTKEAKLAAIAELQASLEE